MKIGFIGTGTMGLPMAANLLRAGHTLAVFNRTEQRAQSLQSLGAVLAPSPQAAAHGAEVVITMLPDTETVEQVLFAQRGVCFGAAPGTVVIDMSTISPVTTVTFAKRLAALGCEMLDAPVSGGEKGAIAGTLGIMAGGSNEVFERCRPLLAAMGKTIVYTGSNGCGQKTKLVNQLVGATNLLAATEGLRLARAAGLDLGVTLEAVSSGAAGSWMVQNLGPLIARENFSPGFKIRLQHKDMKLLNAWLDQMEGEFPAARLMMSLFTRALNAGLGEQGNQGLINIWPSS